MEICALYGPSGTGKSTSALAIAHRHHIHAIIDDGLLVFEGKKVAGYSAKYEKTIIQAVKRAIFFDAAHAEEVRQAIDHYGIHRLLLIGTSKKMILRIVEALHLPDVTLYVPITEVRSSAEIKAALFDRETGGRHVIPIPRMQVEQDFIKKLIARVEKTLTPKKEELGETTIVYPQFGAGKIHVSEKVLKKLIVYCCRPLPYIREFKRIKIDISSVPLIELELELHLSINDNIQQIAKIIQEKIYTAFAKQLNLEVERVAIKVSQIHIQAKK